MGDVSGYARVLAKTRIIEAQTKPFLGKAFVKYGQAIAISGYFMQLGALLGAKHRDQLDAFGPAFLGLKGEPGAVANYVEMGGEDMIRPLVEPGMNFGEFVFAEQIQRFNHEGTLEDFLRSMGLSKLEPKVAAELAWQFAEYGAVLGAWNPDLAREFYEGSHHVDPEAWQRARESGLDIPAQQTVIPYEECLAGEDAAFEAYCKACCPELGSVLFSS